MPRAFILLVLFGLCGVAAADGEIVTARLAWEPGGVGTMSPGRIPFRSEPPKGVEPLPGLQNPRYARIKMAGSQGLLLALDAVEGAPRLWIDHDFDGDLQDDKQPHMHKAGTGWSRRQVVLAPYPDEAEAVPVPLQFFHQPSMSQDYVQVYAQIHRRGTVVLGGRLRTLALSDHSYDACFDDAKRDRIWLDLDGDGDLQTQGDMPERILPGEPFRVGEEGWTVRVPGASGLTVEFERAASVPPARPRTWTDTVIQSSGIRRTPPAESLDVLRKRFEQEQGKPYAERQGTVSTIGAVGTRESLDLLVRIAASDAEPSIRTAALRAMGNAAYLEVGGDRVLALAHDAKASDAYALAQALHSMGHPKREAVYLEMVRSADANAVSGAARYLAFLETDRGRKAILDVIEGSGTPALRYNAYVQGARNLRGGPPLDTILRAAGDDYPTLKAEAIRDLNKLGRPEARTLALELAQERPVQVTIGLALTEVLGAQGDAGSVAAILGLLEDGTVHANVRKAVLEQLRSIRAPGSVAVIVKALKSKGPTVRAVAAEILSAVPQKEVTDALLKRAGKEKDEEVLPLLLEALGDHGDVRALPLLLKKARSRRKGVGRRAAIRALARLGFHTPKVRDYLLGLLSAGDDEDRILALDAAGAAGDAGLVPKVVASLDHAAWQVRLAAVEALDALRVRACIEPLIRRLASEPEERVRDAMASTLFRLTGMNLYDNAEIWRRWWAEHETGFAVPEQIPQPPEQHAGTQAGFYGIPIHTERVIFVIDQSGSMSAPGEAADSYEQKELNRLGVAVREVLAAVAKLKNRARVNVILFHSTIHPWQDKLQRLSSGNRAQLRKHLESKSPTGGTNLYDGLELALRMKDVDTIFLLSDGVPGAGKYVATPDILRAVRRENQTRRVAIHCVSVGMDSELLRLLAQENGGRYVRR